MYTNRVFKDLRDSLADEEILEEIDKAFSPYNKLHLKNQFRDKDSMPIIEKVASLPTEFETLEAIVQLWGRPALLVQNGTFETSESDVWNKRLEPSREILTRSIEATGRIEVENHPSHTWLGTGWMMSEDVLVTNRHVANEFASENDNHFNFKKHQDKLIKTQIDFKEEHDVDTENEIEVQEILWIAPPDQPDVAFLRISGKAPSFIPLKEEFGDGRFLATIGYPAFDSRNNVSQMNRIFNNLYNVKRFQPGMKMFDGANHTFQHDCSTLGGNSGSPVVDISTGHVVGLHYGGRYMHANYAVDSRHILDLMRSLNI